MSSKAMRHWITINENTTSTTAMGAKIDTPSTLFENVPCHYTNVMGLEKFRGRQIQAEVSAVFECRVLPEEITPKHTLTYKGKLFGIVAVLPDEDKHVGGSHYQLILAKTIA